jgi:hypothetical protein
VCLDPRADVAQLQPADARSARPYRSRVAIAGLPPALATATIAAPHSVNKKIQASGARRTVANARHMLVLTRSIGA